jgi:hypothetical protein
VPAGGGGGDPAAFEADLRAALPAGPYVEDVRVSILVASL